MLKEYVIDWEQEIKQGNWNTILVLLTLAYDYDPKYEKLFNHYRDELTSYFIEYVKNLNSESEQLEVLKELLNSQSAIGKILNKPKYPIMVKLTFSIFQDKYDEQHVTASIKKICVEFSDILTKYSVKFNK